MVDKKLILKWELLGSLESTIDQKIKKIENASSRGVYLWIYDNKQIDYVGKAENIVSRNCYHAINTISGSYSIPASEFRESFCRENTKLFKSKNRGSDKNCFKNSRNTQFIFLTENHDTLNHVRKAGMAYRSKIQVYFCSLKELEKDELLNVEANLIELLQPHYNFRLETKKTKLDLTEIEETDELFQKLYQTEIERAKKMKKKVTDPDLLEDQIIAKDGSAAALARAGVD